MSVKRGKWSIAAIWNHYFSEECEHEKGKNKWLSVFHEMHIEIVHSWIQMNIESFQLNHWNQNQWLLNIQRPLINSVLKSRRTMINERN